jgi:hypothetical protein
MGSGCVGGGGAVRQSGWASFIRHRYLAKSMQIRLTEIMRLYWVLWCWGGRRGLNPRHSVPQTDALPAELLPPPGD